jgi:hypothetical protein
MNEPLIILCVGHEYLIEWKISRAGSLRIVEIVNAAGIRLMPCNHPQVVSLFAEVFGANLNP